MTRAVRTLAQRLRNAELAINNTLSNPAILAAVSIYGYDQARLEAGRSLYEEVHQLAELQKKEYGEQHEATADLQRKWDEADMVYMTALKIGRIALRGNESARNALGLDGSRKKSRSGWLEQSRRFYKNMLRTPEFMAKMADYNYTQAKLEAEAALIEEMATASDLQYKERGEAQEATKIRDAKLDELDQWLADYKVVAQVALASAPQRLEQLGWVVES